MVGGGIQDDSSHRTLGSTEQVDGMRDFHLPGNKHLPEVKLTCSGKVGWSTKVKRGGNENRFRAGSN